MASSISQKPIGKLTVVNKYRLPEVNSNTTRIYIGRPSPLGNKFSIGKDGTREEVISKHRNNLAKDIKDPAIKSALRDIINALKEGIDVELVCFCSPLACHGDTLKELVDLHMLKI